MAEPFQPKFVDLVRNTTSTTGTGNFNLGQAIAGFASFATALNVGDRFYYCAVNNDKPQEREVGRGTLLANGVIAREPVQGPPVNFTSGNKMIALVTPAEWFNAIQAGGAGGAAVAETRAALAAVPTSAGTCLLKEAGREGLWLFQAGNLVARVTADANQGLHVAPAGQTGSAGAWVRSYNGAVNVRWFGATGDGTTNDGPAFVAALATLKAMAGNTSINGFYKASPQLFVPAGHYFLGTTTLDITHTLRISGEGNGFGGNAYASRLRWAAATTGIRIQRFNTSGASTVDGTTRFGGDGLALRGLQLVGGYAGSEGEHHGIHAKARFAAEDIAIDNFAGDGIHANCVGGAGDASEGNANNSSLRRCYITRCRNGIFVDGADTNIWDVQAVDVTLNRRWGINDSSFLGNTYSACHADSNGMVPGETPTVVSFAGNRYAVRVGQSAGAASNAPSGTSADNIWWYYIGDGGPHSGANIPSWTNPTTVREGGCYRTDNANAANVFTGCYSEGSQGPAQFSPPTLVVGGGMFAGVKGVARLCVDSSGNVSSTGGLNADGSLTVGGIASSLGPVLGLASDNQVFLNNTNFYNFLTFRSWSGGTPQTDAEFLSARGSGFVLKGFPGIQLRHGPTNATVLDMSSAGVSVTGTLSASGALSAANLSGTNSGDQVITLTGDVTGSGGGSFAATIANNAVSYAKMQDVSAAARLIGRGAASGAGDPQEISLGSRLTMSGTTLNAAGDWTELTLASDFTCANSTGFNDITDGTTPLSWTPPANSAFEIQAVLLIQTVTAANLPRIQVNVAAQGSGAYGCVQIGQTGATAGARVTADGGFTTGAVTVATAAGDLPAANTPYLCCVTVRGRSGAAPAVIKLQAACETAAANACFVKAGSQLRAKAS